MAAKKQVEKTVEEMAEVKARSRERLKEELGKPMEIHMLDVTKDRLKEICKLFGHDNIDEMTRGTGRIYSQVLDELINIFYFNEVLLEPKQPKAKQLFDLYNEFYELKLRKCKTTEEIIAYMTKHKRGRPANMDDLEWEGIDVERLSSARKVVDNILKREKASGG